MTLKHIFLFILPLALAVSSCKTNKCDAEKQAQTDEAVIRKFLEDKAIEAERHPSGMYYKIISPGSGNVSITPNTNITVKYVGRTLDGRIFDQSVSQSVQYQLGQLISGWQVGIPLIQKGGKVRLFIPSQMAYGCDGNSGIPPNTVLDFDVDLIDATN